MANPLTKEEKALISKWGEIYRAIKKDIAYLRTEENREKVKELRELVKKEKKELNSIIRLYPKKTFEGKAHEKRINELIALLGKSEANRKPEVRDIKRIIEDLKDVLFLMQGKNALFEKAKQSFRELYGPIRKILAGMIILSSFLVSIGVKPAKAGEISKGVLTYRTQIISDLSAGDASKIDLTRYGLRFDNPLASSPQISAFVHDFVTNNNIWTNQRGGTNKEEKLARLLILAMSEQTGWALMEQFIAFTNAQRQDRLAKEAEAEKEAGSTDSFDVSSLTNMSDLTNISELTNFSYDESELTNIPDETKTTNWFSRFEDAFKVKGSLNVKYENPTNASGKMRRAYTAIDVFNMHKGDCNEQAYLYVVMCREMGLEAYIVRVVKDKKGKPAHHAVAAVKVDGRFVLVDLTSHEFDVTFPEYEILKSPFEVLFLHYNDMVSHEGRSLAAKAISEGDIETSTIINLFETLAMGESLPLEFYLGVSYEQVKAFLDMSAEVLKNQAAKESNPQKKKQIITSLIYTYATYAKTLESHNATSAEKEALNQKISNAFKPYQAIVDQLMKELITQAN